MFYRRRRLQVLLSLLVIVVTVLYLGSQLISGVTPVVARTSQVGEALFFIRHSYVDKVDEKKLLRAAAGALLEHVNQLGVSAELPPWQVESTLTDEDALRRFEVYLERTLTHSQGKMTREEAAYIALAGLTKALGDPYTRAMDPETYAKFREHLHSQAYGGVGISLEVSQGRFVVFEVSVGSPAAQAGVKVGDLLVKIDGRELVGESLEMVTQQLHGEVDSEVELIFKRAGAIYTRRLKRAIFKTRSVRGRLYEKVGWISVSSMAEATGNEMVETVAQLNEQGAKVLVLDLRDNVGGYLNAGLEVASVFLESGKTVVKVQSRESSDSKHTIGSKVEQKPLLVLVNRRTASSAEILAGAFQDYQRAELMGESTFGKGSIQTLHDFADGGGFKLTTSRYLTPQDRSIEGVGLAPELELHSATLADEELLRELVLAHCKAQWNL